MFRFLTNFTQSPLGYLWEGEDGGAAATPAPATDGASAQPATQANAPQSATPAAPQGSATTPEPGRDGWVPSYRIRETREAAIREANQQWQTKEQTLQQELNQIRSQLHALVGVQPPANPEVQNVKSQFASLYPGLAKIEERAAQLEQLLERSGDLESQSNHYWQSYGRQTMDRLFDTASKTLGAPLSDEGKRNLHSAFVGFVQSSPEIQARYAQDPTLVEEFWQAFSSSLIDPARRSASATVAQRATGVPVPKDGPGGAPIVSQAPKPANLDERVSNAWAQYQQNAKT